MRSSEDAPHYAVVDSDRYEADREAAFLRRLAEDTEFAGRWLKHLEETTRALADFPGPLSHARDEEASVFYGREVRRLLYYGPTKRRTGIPVRVLFTLLPPAEDDPEGETVIFLLRLLHGPQSLAMPEDSV